MRITTALVIAACFAGIMFGRWQVEQRADATPGLITNLAGEVDSDLTAHIVHKYGDGFWLEPISGTGDAIEITSDPNNIVLTTDGIDLMADTSLVIAEDTSDGYLKWSVLTIVLENGEELSLDCRDDKIEITGDADMNEAAKVFFNQYLRRAVDGYVKVRLND